MIAYLVTTLEPPAQVTSRATEQVVIVPEEGVGVRGSSPIFYLPCGFPRPKFKQILFRVPEGVSDVVRSIAFRRYDSQTTPPSYPAFTVDLEIRMAHSPRSTEIPSYDLPVNRGSDFTVVVPAQTIRFPATPPRAGDRHGFDYRIPLTTPFVFRRGAVGVIELRVFRTSACTSNNLGFEYAGLARVSPKMFGAPCTRASLNARELMAGNFSLAFQLPHTFSSPGAHAHVFGGLRKDAWEGLQLPYSLTPLGAPGCSLYISFDWEWPRFWVTADQSQAYVDLTLPNDPAIVGKSVYLQGVLFDPALNPFGFATTQAWEAVVNQHLECPTSTVSAPDGPNGLDGGEVTVGGGPVFLLSDR